MDNFLPARDELSRTIQEKSVVLYDKLRNLPVDSLGMPSNCLTYFKDSHYKRLFFSIQTSAHLLYRAISAVQKKPGEIVIMDYGAGVGTLYTLAKLIGCRKVIYNDHLEEWKNSARLIAEAIEITVDEYIVGDINETLDVLARNNLKCDIITSRNVIEHIYDLKEFYSAIALSQPNAWVYASTTANNRNPATQLQHVRMHRKWEKIYRKEREIMIGNLDPELSENEKHQLAILTRGRAGKDISNSVQSYRARGKLPIALTTRTNTCHPVTGVWVEHLLKFEEYRRLIDNHFKVSFAPGFWDTHYKSSLLNIAGRILNSLIQMNRGIAFAVAPFIYVIAEPKGSKM